MESLLRYSILFFAVGYLVWLVWQYVSVKRVAKFVDNATFASYLRTGQLIDLREPASFRRKHIMGARNFPMISLKASLTALRKDKSVLVYGSNRGMGVARALSVLKKAGFSEIYVLKDGMEYWDGKVKGEK